MKETWFPGHLAILDRVECIELLQNTAIGRVAWCDPVGPVVVPVNYVMDGEAILFRTSPGSALAHQFDLGSASFQIDAYDEYTQSGWSVLVRGRATYVNPEEAADLDVTPEPWAAGDRTFNVRITPLTISGRRIIPT